MNHLPLHKQPLTWINPYIGRSHDLKDRIIVNSSGEVEQKDRDAVLRVTDPYESLIVEIGSGSGQHLLSLGSRYPNSCILGLELRYKRAVRTIEKCVKAGVENVFVARTSALNLAKLIPSGTISELYVNFPDPWSDKRRWKKHRLLNDETLSMIAACLAPGGIFRYKTDHRDSFDDVVQRLKVHQEYAICGITLDLHQSPFLLDNLLTEFEEMFRAQGLPIYFVEAKTSSQCLGVKPEFDVRTKANNLS
jgi:tRNA (guanine-N7-)-methyltransferase